MKRATGAKAASRRAAAACSISVCRARRRPGPRGSTPATWRFSRITRWTATSSSRRRRFVDMVLEAGVQLFEGRAVRRRGLRNPQAAHPARPGLGRALEISYDPNERTFAIQSRFEQGAAWSLHVVGSMRGERTESAFAIDDLGKRGDAGHRAGRSGRLLPLHERSRTALRRGIPADSRTLRRRRVNRRAAWRLSEAIAAARRRISAASGALRRRAANLLRRRRDRRGSPLAHETAGAFRAHPFPPLAGRVRARARRRACSATTSSSKAASASTTKPASRACSSMASARSASPASRRSGAPGGTRDVLYHVDWERTPSSTSARAAAAAAARRNCSAAARHALERGHRHPRSRRTARPPWPPATISPPRSSPAACAKWASTPAQKFTADSLRVAAPMQPVFERLMAKLAKRGC